MRRKACERGKILESLQAVDKQHITDSQENSYTRRNELVQTVKFLVDSVSEDDLKDSEIIKTYSLRLGQRRELEGLKLKEIGEIMGISHTFIEKQENSKKPLQSIDRYYLEAFSLLYHVSPQYLLGKADDPGDYGKYTPYPIEPIAEFEPALIYKTHLIIRNLYQDATELNQRLLIDFLKICDAKYYWRNAIKSSIFSVPIVANLMQATIATAEPDDSIWQDFLCTHTDIRLTIGTCFDIFCSLGFRDPKMFDLFLCLTLESNNVAEFVCHWLENGGFLEKPRSFRKNIQIEKVAIYGGVTVSVPNPNLISEDLDDLDRVQYARSIKMGRLNYYPQINVDKQL